MPVGRRLITRARHCQEGKKEKEESGLFSAKGALRGGVELEEGIVMVVVVVSGGGSVDGGGGGGGGGGGDSTDGDGGGTGVMVVMVVVM